MPAARETLYQQAHATDAANGSEDVPAETPSMVAEPLDVGWAIDVLHPRALQPLAIGEEAVEAFAKIRGCAAGPNE